MSTINPSSSITTTANPVSGGLDAIDGIGMIFDFTFTGAFITGDQVTLVLTDALSGYQTQIGGGYASGVQPNYCYTFNNRIFGLAGSSMYYCALTFPLTWNDPNAAGNGFTVMSNYFSSPATLQAMAPYQGKLLFACRDYCQVWTIDPDPANFAVIQTLPNIGTMAPDSVKAVGDMDVYMLYDSGVRSVRVRDASNNAIIADIGTPIDMLLQSVLQTLTTAQKATACGVVDPAANRYWLYVPTAADNPAAGVTGNIYVFSYFTSSQVAAWSTYLPTYQTVITPAIQTYSAGQVSFAVNAVSPLQNGVSYYWTPGPNETSFVYDGKTYKGNSIIVGTTQIIAPYSTGANGASYTGSLSSRTWFVPQKFEIYQGQVWVRDTNNNVYQYGGANNQAYDNCTVLATLPYIDAGLPGSMKSYDGIGSAFVGNWSIGVSTDFSTQIFQNVFNSVDAWSTYRRKKIPYKAQSSHYAFQVQENGTGYARMSNLVMGINNPPQGYENV